MPAPELNPEAPEGSSSAVDGLLSVLAAVGTFALLAKGGRLVVRNIPKSRLEAARQRVAEAAIGTVQKIVKHPSYKAFDKAFRNKGQPTVSHPVLQQIMREIEVGQLGLIQDLSLVAKTSNIGADMLDALRANILTKYEMNIPQLAKGRAQRMTLDDLTKVSKGTKWQKTLDEVLGPDGSRMGQLATHLGMGRKQLGSLRVDPWLFMDPTGQAVNVARLSPMRVFDSIERVTFAGIPLFRFRTDPRGNKMGTAMFRAKFEDGQETINPVLKLLSGGKQDKGDLAVVNGIAWSRRSSRDPFALLEGPMNKAGQRFLELTSDPRMGQMFFMARAPGDLTNQALYGAKTPPKSDWERLKRFFGLDFGARTNFSKGQTGTIADDILREPYDKDTIREKIRRRLISMDPTGVLGSVSRESLRQNRLGDIGAFSDVMSQATSAGRLYIKSASGLQNAADWANLQVSRPLYLTSKFGVNVRPGRNALFTLGKMAALGTGVGLGIEATKYADWATFGIASGALKHMMFGAEYARQSLLEGSGLQEGMQATEREFPGLFNSPLSKAIRVAGAIGIGAFVGAKFGAPQKLAAAIERSGSTYVKSFLERGRAARTVGGLMLGTGAGGLFGLMTSAGDLRQSPEEVTERFRGDRKVPYRVSKGWMLGRDPMSGGRISFYRDSMYRTFGVDVEAIAAYGSEANKWRYGSWIPTAQNLGGLRRLVNPYFAEERNLHTRPYPVTGGHFADVPIFGPLLQPTVGSLLKPQKFWTPTGYSLFGGGTAGPGVGVGGTNIAGTGGGQDTLAAINTMTHSQAAAALQGSYVGGSGFTGASPQEARALGFRPGSVVPMHANTPGIDTGLMYQIRAIEEFMGLRGFQTQFLRESLFGSAYPGLDRPVLAQSSSMTSASRGYYDVEPGGLLGLTELPRRFLLRPYKQPEVNMIPNSLPRFLPGTLSEFEQDRTWGKDFSRGDPYTQIPQGSHRLPGPGYEALHQLHGRSSYDVVDSFLILADVAPFSQAYRYMKTEVERQIRSGQIHPDWIRKYQIAVEQAETRAGFRVYHRNKYEAGRVTIDKVLSPTSFTTREDPATVVNLRGTVLDPRSDAMALAEMQRRGMGVQEARMQLGAVRSEMQAFLEERRGRTIELSVTGRRPGSVEAEVPGYLDLAESLGMRGQDTEDLRSQGVLGKAYSGTGKLLGEAGFTIGGILNFMTARKTGSPAGIVAKTVLGAATGGIIGGWAENKFTGDFSAVEHYNRFQKYGTAYADWTSPYSSFVRPWVHNAASTLLEYTPGYRQEQRDVEEYFDKLSFVKYSGLAEKAKEAGEHHMASRYEAMASETMTGLDYSKLSPTTPGITRALPASERQYFRAFASEADPATRAEIIESVPEYMRGIYLSIWKNAAGQKSLGNPELDLAYQEYAMPLTQGTAKERAEEYFATKSMPAAQSGFWHPSVNVEDVKYKAIEMNGGNAHLHGLYESQSKRINAFQPDIATIAQDVIGSYGSLADRNDYMQTQKMLWGRDASADLYIMPRYAFKTQRGRVDILQDDREAYMNHYKQLALGKGIW